MLQIDLKKEVIKYINHKVVLSKVTDWYSVFPQNKSIVNSIDLVKLFQFHSNGFGSKQIAKMVLQKKIDLYNILPNPNNKTYKSQTEKIDSIINYCNQLLK